MKKLKGRPFALVGAHVGGSTVKELAATMEKEKLPWRSFVDLGNATTGPISVKWNFPATPTFYLIDHKGVIRHKWTGAPGEKVIDAALDKLIRAAEESGKKPPR